MIYKLIFNIWKYNHFLEKKQLYIHFEKTWFYNDLLIFFEILFYDLLSEDFSVTTSTENSNQVFNGKKLEAQEKLFPSSLSQKIFSDSSEGLDIFFSPDLDIGPKNRARVPVWQFLIYDFISFALQSDKFLVINFL